MSFDSCREDIEEGYPCDCGGSTTENKEKTKWKCDSCDFEREVKENESD